MAIDLVEDNMKRILCALPNASSEISGIKFNESVDGFVSEPIEDENLITTFLSIPGYSIFNEQQSIENDDPEGDIEGDESDATQSVRRGRKAKLPE